MNDFSSRRAFLKTAALLPIAATGGASALAAVEPIKRLGGPQLKVSCNAYSFARQLGTGGRGTLSLMAFAEFCAKANFDAIDPTGYYFPGYEKNGLGVPTDAFIFELKRRAFDLGLGISGTGIGNIDTQGNVHPDQFWQSLTLGNVKNRKFSEIWSDNTNETLAALRTRNGRLEGKCASCRYLGICGGGFRVRAVQVHNNLWASDPACYLTGEEVGAVETAA